MYIAYSAFRISNHNQKKPQKLTPVYAQTQLRYIGYQAACKKYEREITAIQQYLPNWEPLFIE